jgi:hypothetical protein
MRLSGTRPRALDDGGISHATALAYHLQASAPPGPEVIHHRGEEACPGCPERVPEGDGAARGLSLAASAVSASHASGTGANASFTWKVSMSSMVETGLGEHLRRGDDAGEHEQGSLPVTAKLWNARGFSPARRPSTRL